MPVSPTPTNTYKRFHMPKCCKIFQFTIAMLLLAMLQTNAQELAVASKSRNPVNLPGLGRSNADVLFLVKGTVSDASGTIAGVTVTEQGTSNATFTDINGRFSLNVASSTSVLVFTSVNYKAKEVPVDGKSTISVTLESTSAELTGVVVTALGISRAKKSLGYSIEEVAGKEMNRVAQSNVL